ncbi:cell traversal protein for ookinetes and sporozoites [Plasmodium gonderi]|uniref:Cell traversal protein for ookinetes and sporozoites n=1 Tax=Plasmodium gonderi TaxID=77519 RepID=A0A1Y1JPX8_PLAGO|nr:cell traversal protein for ookinetes and sporozoites [Plasmodium gonderi]GAW83548.1 cell traversal protein for ookinetes and sporozoites [Plasmodium gonderi]
MNKVNRLSIVSAFIALFCFVNVLSLRGKSGSTAASSSLEAGTEFSERIGNSLSSFLSESSSLEVIGNELADNIANEIVNSLQKDSASFLQSGFDVKSQLKTTAKKVLLEALKAALEPTENIVASTIKPPRVSEEVYFLIGPVVKTLFNKVEDVLHKPVPDKIWEYEAKRGASDEEEDEDDFSDDLLD